MNKKDVANFRKRIKRASQSLSIGGDMLLSFDIDKLDLMDKLYLSDRLKEGRAPVTYAYLERSIKPPALRGSN